MAGVVFCVVCAGLAIREMALDARGFKVGRAQLRIASLGYLIARQVIVYEDKPLALPRGDIRALCKWVEGREGIWHAWRWRTSNLEHEQVVDPWGRPLVYRFPASTKEKMFDLYSTGPNGVDEMGGGDDITCGPDADFGSWSQYFKGGIIDVDWVRAHLDDLKRDRNRKIIGAPPEKLKDIE